MNFFKRIYTDYKAAPIETINKALNFVGKAGIKYLEITSGKMELKSEELERIQQYKNEEPQLPIGRVELASSLQKEASNNDVVNSFVMGCVRRARDYDWGDSSDEQKKNNDYALINENIIECCYDIPENCLLGESYPTQIVIRVDRQNKTTTAFFPGEEN